MKLSSPPFGKATGRLYHTLTTPSHPGVWCSIPDKHRGLTPLHP